MKCPREETVLAERRQEGFTFHTCPSCHGLWFTWPEFQGLIKKASSTPSRGQPPAPTPTGWGSTHPPAACPVDGVEPMGQHVIHGVQVDLCLTHRGLWLDPGELNQLIQRFQAAPGSGAETGALAGAGAGAGAGRGRRGSTPTAGEFLEGLGMAAEATFAAGEAGVGAAAAVGRAASGALAATGAAAEGAAATTGAAAGVGEVILGVAAAVFTGFFSF